MKFYQELSHLRAWNFSLIHKDQELKFIIILNPKISFDNAALLLEWVKGIIYFS